MPVLQKGNAQVDVPVSKETVLAAGELLVENRYPVLPAHTGLVAAYLAMEGLGVLRGIWIKGALSELVVAVSMGDEVCHGFLKGDAFGLGYLFGLLVVGEGEGEEFTNCGRYLDAFIVGNAEDFFVHLGFDIAVEAAHGRRGGVTEELKRGGAEVDA